jgi:hypothetical protein
LVEGFRAILNAWDDFRIEADEFRVLDSARVLVLDRYSGRGKASGIQLADMQPRGVTVFHLRGGKVTKMIVYWERETGLADLGLHS